MTSDGLHFASEFWSEEFLSTSGFDAIVKRMKEGTVTCKSLINFFRQRAKLEDEYVKGLQRMVKNTDYTNEIGKLREGLESLRMLADKTVEEHQSASKGFVESADRIEAFMEKQKNEMRLEKEKVEKIIKEKQKLYEKTTSAMKSYHQKSQEAETAEQNVIKAKAATNRNPKDVEKTSKIREKAVQDAEKADQSYHELIRSLDEVRCQWEKDIFQFFEFCEDEEKHRISTLQNEMWAQCNIISIACVSDDMNCENTRAVLEDINPEADIAEFVYKSQIGNIRPAPITYESYKNAKSGSMFNQSEPPLQTSQPPQPLPPQPLLPHLTHKLLPTGSIKGRPVPARPAIVTSATPSPSSTQVFGSLAGTNRVFITNGKATLPAMQQPSATVHLKPSLGSVNSLDRGKR